MTSRHPAVSCACPKCQSERRTTPPPATEEREALGATVSAFWDTKDTVESCINAVLSALAPYRAAEILAAEANERARIVAWLRGKSGVCNDWDDEWKFAATDFAQFICFGYHKMTQAEYDAIERNEHGAGK